MNSSEYGRSTASKLFILSVCLITLFVVTIQFPRKSTTTAASYGAQPFTFKARMLELGMTLPESTGSQLKKMLWPRRGDPLSVVLHALHIFPEGEEPPSVDLPTLAEMRSLLLDDAICSQWYSGRHVVILTRHGARFVDVTSTDGGGESQSHRDQALAVLGELGVPLSTEVITSAERIPLKLLMDDAVANYSTDQEIEWTALALTRYLPPSRSWQDKFGGKHDFDELAQVLLRRPLYASSCGGTHVLHSLAVLLRADQKHSLLSTDVRESVHQILLKSVKALSLSQESNGAFAANWYEPLITRGEKDAEKINNWRWILDSPTARDRYPVLVTGHHLEWLMSAPVEIEFDKDICLAATRYLLNRANQATPAEIDKSYCPFAHAYFVLRHVD